MKTINRKSGADNSACQSLLFPDVIPVSGMAEWDNDGETLWVPVTPEGSSSVVMRPLDSVGASDVPEDMKKYIPDGSVNWDGISGAVILPNLEIGEDEETQSLYSEILKEPVGINPEADAENRKTGRKR